MNKSRVPLALIVATASALATGILPTSDGDHDRDDSVGHFVTLRSAKVGEVSRGVALAPSDHDHDGRGSDH